MPSNIMTNQALKSLSLSETVQGIDHLMFRNHHHHRENEIVVMPVPRACIISIE